MISPAVDGEGRLSTIELCRRSGATYRQLDYWARLGILRPHGNSCPGTGVSRRWDATLAPVARRLAVVSKLFEPRRSLLETFQGVANGHTTLSEVIDGVRVTVTLKDVDEVA
jgi:hypothetical protein